VADARSGVREHLLASRRLVFVALVIIALVTGYVGFAQFLRGNAEFGHGPLDLLYDDLQLFVLGPFPLQQGGTDFPVALQIARLTAPLVTAYAFVEAGRLFLAAELRRWRIQRIRGHLVVCGSGPIAAILADRLSEAGNQVVTVQPGPAAADKPGQWQVFGDARVPDVLRAASVHRAKTLYACTDDTATNTSIALAAGRLSRGNGTDLAIYAQASDPDLCLALQARYLGLTQRSQTRFGFFNVDELAARKLLADRPLTDVDGRPPHVLVLGASSFGRAIVVELARRWRITQHTSAVIPTVVLVDKEASAAVADIVYRYEFVTRTCQLRAYDDGLEELLAKQDPHERPTAVFVCMADEEACLRTALTADGLWHAGPGSVTVRLGRLAALRDAFDGSTGDTLLDEVDGVVRLFDVLDAACDPELIREDLIERLARVVHDRYFQACLRRGDLLTDNASLVAWEHLPAAMRQSCRAQAEDVGRKLRAIGCTVAPRVAPGESFQLTDDRIELLAQMEHHRWMAERTDDGWTFGPQRDEGTRGHPDLVPWELLSPVAQAKNRDAMREFADIVADAGFSIIQL
jgi:hypothetical protein